MIYYAHTADELDGKPARVEHWQLLKDHLCGVADRAPAIRPTARIEVEAELARDL